MDIEDSVDDLIYIKDARYFNNIKLIELTIKSCKKISAFHKFQNLRTLKLTDINFKSKNIEFVF